MKRGIPLHIYLSTLFLAVSLGIGGIVAIAGYRLSHDLLETSAAELTPRVGREVLGVLQNHLKPADQLARVISHSALVDARSFEARWQQLPMMRAGLDSSGVFSSLFVGYADGDFFMLRRLAREAQRAALDAPAEAAYLVQSIDRGPTVARGRFLYLDADLKVLSERERPDYPDAFDPRQRIWYEETARTDGTVTSEPYIFHTDRQVGMTVARRDPSGAAVIGTDVTLEALDDALQRQAITPSTHLVLTDQAGRVIAYKDVGRHASPSTPVDRGTLKTLESLGIPALAALGELPAEHTTARVVEAAGETWRVMSLPLALDGAPPLQLILAIPSRELFAAALSLRRTAIGVTLLLVLGALPAIWLIARAISRSLRRLAREAEAIRHFDFDEPLRVRSSIVEVQALAETMQLTKSTIRRFLNVVQAVAAEKDFDRLLPVVLRETMLAGRADLGVLYRLDRGELHPAAALEGDGRALTAGLPPIAAEQAPALMRQALSSMRPCTAPTEPASLTVAGLDGVFSAAQKPYAIAVPLIDRQRETLGLMLLYRREALDPAELGFIAALAGTASSSLETRELIKAQKALFEAFIQLIAGAIDAKSPYTGGHCARVPELTKMLARAACAETEGPFREFQLSEEQWEAVHVAAWLHDCGKVTTPEYVVDKATKLETLHNRIHEVRTRFEVLKRDARIECLQALLDGTPAEQAQRQLEDAWRTLDEEFAFVAQCNLGTEHMADEDVARLTAIAERRWLRTLDDRLGLSHEELSRYPAEAPALPVVESLLADRPEQRIPRPAPRTDLPGQSTTMAVPELLYDRGELHNLGVRRGTLNAEERYKINEHIVQTIAMLSQLPFPRHLAQVPEIAGGHHEKMDGTGYPRGLRQDQMSPVARMMAIADIFEALTAVDRPYKTGKTLSESIRIMARMAREQHIDPELFDLFLRAGVYREYAERFMRPEQIDEVALAF